MQTYSAPSYTFTNYNMTNRHENLNDLLCLSVEIQRNFFSVGNVLANMPSCGATVALLITAIYY